MKVGCCNALKTILPVSQLLLPGFLSFCIQRYVEILYTVHDFGCYVCVLPVFKKCSQHLDFDYGQRMKAQTIFVCLCALKVVCEHMNMCQQTRLSFYSQGQCWLHLV